MPDSNDAGKAPDAPRPVKPAVPPFRGPGSGAPSPLRPMDPNSRLTRPPFIPPAIAGRKPVATPAAPARPGPVAPVGAASIPDIAVPTDRAQELVEAIRPMSSSTATPSSSVGAPSTAAPSSTVSALPADASSSAYERQASALTPTPAEATAVTADPEVQPVDYGRAQSDPFAAAPPRADEWTTPAAPPASEAGAPEFSGALPFLDPAPFVGTRETALDEPESTRAETASPNAEFSLGNDAATEARASHEPAASAAVLQPRSATSHPLARALNELAAQIDNGDLQVVSFEEGMSTEAALAATLAAMLKRAR